MYDNWTEVRSQLDQALAAEQTLHQARRRRQPSLWHSLRQWWLLSLRLAPRQQPAPGGAAPSVTPPALLGNAG